MLTGHIYIYIHTYIQTSSCCTCQQLRALQVIPLALSCLCGVLTVQLQDSSCKAVYLFVSSLAIATSVSRCSRTDLSPDGCVTGDSEVSLRLRNSSWFVL